MTNQDLFKQDDFRQQYELAKQSGKRALYAVLA